MTDTTHHPIRSTAADPATDTATHSVITIDDHPLFRKGLADLIAMDASLQLVGDAASGEEGLERVRELQPDLVLLDLNMKGMDGIETLKAIKAEDLDTCVIMLTVSDNEENVVSALRAGADGYLLKDMEPEDILKQILSAAQGRLVISERLTELMARALREAPQPSSPDQAGLTGREREIVELIARGLSNKLIARELDITEGTVKVHIKNLLKKLNLHSRLEVAVWALEHR